MHLDIQVDRAEEGWVCDVLLEPGPPTAREGCFLSMDPGLVTMKDAWTLFPLHPEHDAVVPPKEEIHVMAQGHLQGGTPSLWGFTFQEAACDQWVLRPRVWTAHSPIKMTVYNCGHKPLHIGPSTRLGLALFWPAERSDNLDAGRIFYQLTSGALAAPRIPAFGAPADPDDSRPSLPPLMKRMTERL